MHTFDLKSTNSHHQAKPHDPLYDAFSHDVDQTIVDCVKRHRRDLGDPEARYILVAVRYGSMFAQLDFSAHTAAMAALSESLIRGKLYVVPAYVWRGSGGATIRLWLPAAQPGISASS